MSNPIKKFLNTYFNIILPNMTDKIFYSSKFLSTFYPIELFIFINWYKEFSFESDITSTIVFNNLCKYGPDFNFIIRELYTNDNYFDCIVFMIKNYIYFNINLDEFFIFFNKNKINNKISHECLNIIKQIKRQNLHNNLCDSKDDCENDYEGQEQFYFDSEYDSDN